MPAAQYLSRRHPRYAFPRFRGGLGAKYHCPLGVAVIPAPPERGRPGAAAPACPCRQPATLALKRAVRRPLGDRQSITAAQDDATLRLASARAPWPRSARSSVAVRQRLFGLAASGPADRHLHYRTMSATSGGPPVCMAQEMRLARPRFRGGQLLPPLRRVKEASLRPMLTGWLRRLACRGRRPGPVAGCRPCWGALWCDRRALHRPLRGPGAAVWARPGPVPRGCCVLR